MRNENRFLQDIIKRALSEDLGKRGDITSEALFSGSQTAKAAIHKQNRRHPVRRTGA